MTKPYNSLRIRPKSEQKPSRWEWLNKPIVLWFLSSVVLSAVTLTYGTMQANRQAALAKQAILDKYKALIGVRLGVAMQRLFDFRKKETNYININDRKSELLAITQDMLNGTPATNLYPEYEHVSIIGLAFQASELDEQRDFSIPDFTSLASYESRIIKAETAALVDEEAVRLLTFETSPKYSIPNRIDFPLATSRISGRIRPQTVPGVVKDDCQEPE